MEDDTKDAKMAANKEQLAGFKHIFSWTVPERHWSPKDRDWYLWRALLFIFLIFFSAVTEQYFLILALIALLLLLFTHASVPPRIVKHEITNRGIKAFDILFKWRDIDYYWITEKTERSFVDIVNRLPGKKYRLLNFDMRKGNPARLSLLLNNDEEEYIVFTLLDHIPYADPEETSDDLLSRLIYGKHIELKHYAPGFEEYPETSNYPEQKITELEAEVSDRYQEIDKEKQEQLKELKRSKQKEEKRKRQLEQVDGERPPQSGVPLCGKNGEV